jgi:hypothetical protein
LLRRNASVVRAQRHEGTKSIAAAKDQRSFLGMVLEKTARKTLLPQRRTE